MRFFRPKNTESDPKAAEIFFAQYGAFFAQSLLLRLLAKPRRGLNWPFEEKTFRCHGEEIIKIHRSPLSPAKNIAFEIKYFTS